MSAAVYKAPRPATSAKSERSPPFGRTINASILHARRRAVAGVITCVLALGSIAFLWPLPRVTPSTRTTAAPASARLITVEPRRATIKLTMFGTIAPGRTVAVISPLDGAVIERRVELGAVVKAGDALLVLDSGPLENRYREALSTLLKTQATHEAVMDWHAGPEMRRARRTLETSVAILTRFDAEVSSLKALFDKGIISRNEYEGVVQQRDAQAASVAGYRDDLAATSAQGSDEKRRTVELELENAKARVADLKRQLDGATITAPAAGIVARPPTNLATPLASAPIQVGSQLSRGQPIYSIADTETFVAVGKADEVDVNRLRIGQRVSITSEAFPGIELAGTLTSVSAEAAPSSGSDNGVLFDVRAHFAPRDAVHRAAIRIGMSVKMSITTFSAEDAIVVPIGAIERGGQPQATVIDPDTGTRRSVAVSLGPTTEEGIVVLSGLQPGDQLVVH
jgi:HlyD family secretion protein